MYDEGKAEGNEVEELAAQLSDADRAWLKGSVRQVQAAQQHAAQAATDLHRAEGACEAVQARLAQLYGLKPGDKINPETGAIVRAE